MCFSEKIQKFFWKDISREYLVVSNFLWEVPKFKENVYSFPGNRFPAKSVSIHYFKSAMWSLS